MDVPQQSVLFAAELCRCGLLRDLTPERVTAIFTAALQGAGATVVGTLAHEFAGGGLTSVLILAESHAVLHSWPETGLVNIDIFSCSTRLQSLVAIDELSRAFGAGSVLVQEIARVDGHVASAGQRV